MFDCYTLCFDRDSIIAAPWCIKCTSVTGASSGYVEKVIGKIDNNFILNQKASQFPDVSYEVTPNDATNVETLAENFDEFFDSECLYC